MDPIAAAKAFAKAKQLKQGPRLTKVRVEAFLAGVAWLNELMQAQFAAIKNTVSIERKSCQ